MHKYSFVMYLPDSNVYWGCCYFQILMSVPVLNHLVTHTPTVLTQLVTLFANVLKDILEMALSVKVNTVDTARAFAEVSHS